jgi:site-specific recombinase XerD
MRRFRNENDPAIAAPRPKAKRVADCELDSAAQVNREMAARFRKWLTAQNYLRSTVQKYGGFADAFCDYIKTKPLREVVPLDISDFITSNLPSRWTDTLVNDRLACLRSFFDFLYLGGAVSSIPARSIRTRKVQRKLPRVFTQRQIRRLLIKTKGSRDRALLELLYGTGCRMIEVRNMRIEDIDFGARKIIVRGKRKERMVYFGPPAARAIKRHMGKRKAGFLFRVQYRQQKGHIHPTSRTWVGHYAIYEDGKRIKKSKYLGMLNKMTRSQAEVELRQHLKGVNLTRPVPDKPICQHTAWKILTLAARRVGLRFLPARMLRHSFATHLWENGADLRVIQELLGHSFLTSTEIYVRISNRAVATTYKRVHPRGA